MEEVGDNMYPLDESETVILLGDSIFIDMEDFEERFGSIEEHEFKYDYFIIHKKTTNAWEDVFEEWKEKGILK